MERTADSSQPNGKGNSNLSRRQFLVHSAGIAGASIGIGMSARGGPGGEIRLGLIGAGERGTHLLNAALQCAGARVAAVADVAPQHLQRAREIARAHQPAAATAAERVLELAAGGKLDAVIIATPPHLHREQALEALRLGMHVYLEKPMALSVADCEEVLREALAAEARGQVFQIGLQRRYNPRYLAAIEAIRRGDAGRILSIRSQWHTLGNPAKPKAWYYRRERSGDLILEQACHQMDVFNWVFDALPTQACGLGGTNRFEDDPPGRSIRDHYGLVIEYPGGAKVHHSHLTYAVPDRRFSGVYELAFGERLGIDLGNALAWDRSGKTVELCRQGGSDTALALEGFLGHIRRRERSQAGADTGYRATMVSLLGLKALDGGRVAGWEELFA